MASRRTVGAAVAGLGLVLLSALGTGAMTAARGADPTAPRQVTPWAGHLDTMDEAVTHNLAARGVSPSERAQVASLTSDRITVPEDI